MRILIQKFGGTSVHTPQVRAMAVEKIVAAKKSGYSPIVVVSAMGRAGEPYATDTLLQFAYDAAGSEIAPRDRDLLMSCGETISAVVMAGLLEARGYAAHAVTGWQAGIFTNDRFGSASYYEVDIARLSEMLNAGVIHRIGPHRFNVKLARALASQGAAVLRMDLSGQGDSGVHPQALPFQEQAIADLRAAMDHLQRICSVDRFVIAGICSGAFNGLATALVDERVAGLWMLEHNPDGTPAD